jgi:hypothetical protein
MIEHASKYMKIVKWLEHTEDDLFAYKRWYPTRPEILPHVDDAYNVDHKKEFM